MPTSNGNINAPVHGRLDGGVDVGAGDSSGWLALDVGEEVGIGVG